LEVVHEADASRAVPAALLLAVVLCGCRILAEKG
jgi:hypothetical protein